MDNGEHGREGHRWSLRGVLLAAALVLVPAASAAAQVPTVPGVTLPTRIVSEPVAPETGETTPPTATTVPPQPPPTTTPTTTARATNQRSGARRVPRAPTPTPPTTAAVVAPVLVADDEQAGAPDDTGAVPTARELGFPLALAGLVSAFVAVQGRLDRRDPKLAAAPISVDDDLLGFE